MKLAELYVEYRAKGLGRLHAGMKTLHARLRRAETAMMDVARAGRRAFIGLAAIIGGTTYAAAKFQKELAMVSTMLDEGSMKYMKQYERELSRLSVAFGEGTATLAKGLYDILSASVAPVKALRVLETSVRAAKAGMTSAAVSTQAIVGTLNAYKLSVEDAGIVSDKLFATVKRGMLTFEQLAASMGKASATAAIAGLSLDEFLAAIATITRANISADLAMTAVVGTIRSFIKPADEAKKLAAELGFELSTATLRTEGLAGVFKRLNKLTAEQLAVLFPNIRGLKGVAAAMQDLGGFTSDVAFITGAAGRTQEAFAKTTDTLFFKLARTKQEFFAMARTLGNLFMPYVQSAVEHVRKFVRFIADLPDPLKRAIVKLTLAATAISALMMALGPATKALRLFVGLLVGIVAHPLLAVVAAAAAIAGHFVLARTEGEGLLEKLSNLGTALVEMAKHWKLMLKVLWTGFKLFLVRVWEGTKHTFTVKVPAVLRWLRDNWLNIFKDIFNFTKTYWSNLFENVRRMFVAFVRWVVRVDWKGMWDGFRNAFVNLAIDISRGCDCIPSPRCTTG